MAQSPDRLDLEVSGRLAPSPYSAGIQFWTLVDESIQDQTRSVPRKPRMSAMNIPLVGALVPPAIGWVNSIGVDFNCRIVGYQIFQLTMGQLTIDIQKSDIVTQPGATGSPEPFQFPSIIGVTAPLPSISGAYADSFDGVTDITLWQFRELSIGDMLHFYITATDGLPRSSTMMLYLQDLDERT